MSHVDAPAEATRKGGQLVSLQYLRAVAAMMIVFTHGWDQLPWLKERIPNVAQSGVDLFFVISGFIMVYVTAKAGSSALHFFRMRIVRIVPLYWLYTFATAALILAVPQLFKTSVFTVPHLVQSLFFIPHWSPSGSVSPMILLGWTLELRDVLLCHLRHRHGDLGNAARPSCDRRALDPAHHEPLRQFRGNRSGGVLQQRDHPRVHLRHVARIAVLEGRSWPRRRANRCGLDCRRAIGLCIGGYHYESSRALSFGVPAALIIAGALSIEAARPVAKMQPFLLLGDASYSIYLAHLFPIALLRFGWSRLALPTDSLGPVLAFMAIALLGGALAGVASYLWLERPLLQVMRRPSAIRAPIPITGRPAASDIAAPCKTRERSRTKLGES